MVEPLSVEEPPAYPKPGPSRAGSFLFRTYLTFLSLCAVAALILAAISTHRTRELDVFKSSLFVTDLVRIFNSTAYAISDTSSYDSECGAHPAERFTGQTTLPGQCVTVPDSLTLWVTRLADNCTPYIYAQENCTGAWKGIELLGTPACIVGAGEGDLAGSEGDQFRSFQISCT
ncbi:uncharacterized protein BO80DRAFT_231341 [Aspergillus ibericus CBS 121593]|uniref:Uncharacterized protein n=1 Tax=Aspergillus ibericus CBS 121593 TaxID=1448316 RepID=A0A395H8I8_9EURO|nr:hypothetical protein BO80DRAFT_231341 [Aspergillus ibericus CBS 121593]RAL04261.1 hypothetical protein BO80DRAFT_231341 [Aspergillus ibericus CBS 121593]